MDNEKRAALIRMALMEKTGQGVSMFTSDDILTVAGITEREVETFLHQVERSIDLLSQTKE